MSDCPRDSVDCRSAVQKLWDYLDEELTPERMDAVREHLERCGSCLPHHDYARAFLEALTTARPATCAPTALRQSVLEKLREAGFKS